VRLPLLTRAARPATLEVQAIDEHGCSQPTAIAGEHPLTVYLDRREIVTLMTLGAAPEELAIGYLRNQGLLGGIDDVHAVQVDWDVSAVAVTSRALAERGEPLWGGDDAAGALARRLSRRTVTTGCGQGTVFGDLMDSIAPLPADAGPRLSREVLHEVLDRVRRHESIYKVAGAVHGCALCANDGERRGEILRFVEDVGRHNAVDAIAGWMWLHGVSGHDKLFYTTGRLTSEMVIKCAQIGVPFLISRSGLTQMGHALALRLGLTMFGRCQGRHYLLFTGAHRYDGPGGAAATS
jgi:FdhD protein